MRADEDVVGNLDLVVEAHVDVEFGVLEGAAIDRGVGADLAIIANAHAAKLWHLDPVVAIEGQAKAIGTQHRTGMDQHAATKANAANQGDARGQAAIGANHAIRTDMAVCAEFDAIADHRVGLDHAMRANRSACCHLGRGRDDGTCMDARRGRCVLLEQAGNARKGDVRIGGDEQASPGCGGIEVAGGNDHGPGAGARQLSAIARIGEEAELAGAGMGEGGDAFDQARAIPVQFEAEARGDVAEFERRAQGLATGLPSLPFRRSSTWSVTSMRWLA